MYDGTLAKAISYFIFFLFIGRLSGLGYHRWLSHKQLEPNIFGRIVLLWSMVFVGTAKPVDYVVMHRSHHKYSDTDKDPHPRSIGLWRLLTSQYNEISLTVPIKDIIRKPDVMFVNKYYWLLYFVNLGILFIIDYQVALLSFALFNLSDIVFSSFFNYYAHDDNGPVNMPLWTNYAIFAGENLHLNHHIDPSNPNFGSASKYNIDLLYYFTKVFFNPISR
jgi:stearoyl-CoA desaturase (delta-9 desaturase)